EPLGGVHPRGEHIVGVAGPGDGLAADRPAVLLEGHDVGEHLTGMRAAGGTIDDRHGGMTRELRQRGVIERAGPGDVDIARENAGRVGGGFAPARLQLLAGQQDGCAPELAHGDVEGDARAGRRLVEDRGERAALERPRTELAARLHGAAGLDHPAQLLRRDVDKVEKVAAAVGAHPAASRFCGLSWALAMRAQARSMRLLASATSSPLTISGGNSRTTLSPAATVIIFSARSSSTRSALGTTARRPTRSPSPRSSAMTVG